MKRIILLLALCTGLAYCLEGSPQENFLLIDGATEEVLLEFGSQIHERATAASTFKIVLSLIGYDTGVLRDASVPLWEFREGYLDYIPAWRAPQTPKSWIKTSCLWYSQLLAAEVGMDKIQQYLIDLCYGNQDLSGGPIPWVSSSLKISPKEQADLIQRLVQGRLPVSEHAVSMTKSLLFLEELPNGWRLFGRTGLGTIHPEEIQIGWFVGWIEDGERHFPFAYNVRAPIVDTSLRIPRVKGLLFDALHITFE